MAGSMNTDILTVGIIKFAYNGESVDILSVNDYYVKFFGMTHEEYRERRPDADGLRHALVSDYSRDEDNIISFYFRFVKKSGEDGCVGINAKLERVEGGSFIFDACAYDINWIVNRLTNYDKLTNLPKIHLFNSVSLDYLKNRAESDGFAVIAVDLNNFKLINEKIGTDKGDKVLTDLGAEIEHFVKARGTCCRAFSDKYLMFIKYDIKENIKTKAEKLIWDFTARVNEENGIMSGTVSASVGIYYIEKSEETDIVKAVDKANIARKNAKALQNAQENCCVVYEEEMKTELSRAMQITGEAERAIANREFVVFYQPKISLKENKVIGAEALVRWQKPGGTLIPPGEFLPYLEKSSFIKEVDFYVYEEVCRHIKKNTDRAGRIIPISVNVSREHLKGDSFIERVNEIVSRYGIEPANLEFELTENAFLDDEQRAVQILHELREKGYLVSIDDFGSGYSSLNLLKTLPVDVLKLDRTFFGRSDLIENNAIVVESIIDMANRMNISVICEGVETPEQVEFLKNTECKSVQGFYYARPIPEEEYEDFINTFEAVKI